MTANPYSAPYSTPSFAQVPAAIELQGYGVRLAPLSLEHAAALEQAAADGQLWRIRVTSVPEPGAMRAYIEQALQGLDEGHMLPFAIIESSTNTVIGSTRYHDIVPSVARLEIGYTWYAASWQRTHVNTACKLALLRHAFNELGAQMVGWRTDNFNYASQRAIERLGAHKDGTLRHHALRRDGTVRDTVMYSVLAGEWPEIEKHLEYQLAKRHAD